MRVGSVYLCNSVHRFLVLKVIPFLSTRYFSYTWLKGELFVEGKFTILCTDTRWSYSKYKFTIETLILKCSTYIADILHQIKLFVAYNVKSFLASVLFLYKRIVSITHLPYIHNHSRWQCWNIVIMFLLKMQTNNYNHKREEVTNSVIFTWNGTVQFWCVRGCGELRQQYFSHRERVLRTLVLR